MYWEKYLRKLRPSANGWYSCCCPDPGHEDNDPSCGFHPEKGFKCHTCGFKASVSEACSRFGWENPSSGSSQVGVGNSSGENLPVAIYDYHDHDGKLVARVKRFEANGKKWFSQHSFVDGQWEKRRAFKFPIYRLPKLLKSRDPIYWVEGEKCVDYLESNGFLSTTTSGGSNNLCSSDLSTLQRFRGRIVFILRDYDDAGLKYSQAGARELSKAGAIAVPLELPGDLSGGQDVVDWCLGKGGSKERLLALSEKAQAGSRDFLALSVCLSEFSQRLIEGCDPGEVRGEILRRVSSLGQNRECRNVTISEAIEEFANDISSGRSEDRVYFGIDSVDSVLGGVEPQELITLGGDPGFGKTAFAFQAAMHIANTQGDVLVVSQEMSPKSLGKRACALNYEISPRQITADQARQLARILRETSLEIVDGRLDLDSLEMVCRSWASKAKKPRLIVIDYLQLTKRGARESETEFTNRATPIIKGLAKELNTPIVQLAQGSKSGRSQTEPDMSYFRGSSSIESDSDRVLILWADIDDPVEISGYNYMKKPVALYFLKQREGPKARIRLHYAEPLTKFKEREEVETRLTGDQTSPKIRRRKEAERFEEVSVDF